jgi:hypothetical protein
MEQVWLALIKAGQPVSDVTWVVENDWYAGDRFHQDGVRRADDDDLVYWANGQYCSPNLGLGYAHETLLTDPVWKQNMCPQRPPSSWSLSQKRRTEISTKP